MAPLVTVRVVDELEAGCGSLDATLWRFLHLARARGPDCDVGQAMRYLAELPWCPMAYVDHDDSLSFADVAEDRLRVTYDDRSDVWVDLHVDPAGDVIGISTDGRPRMEGKRTVLRPWSGVFADHAEQAGVRVPRKGAVTWHLPRRALRDVARRDHQLPGGPAACSVLRPSPRPAGCGPVRSWTRAGPTGDCGAARGSACEPCVPAGRGP